MKTTKKFTLLVASLALGLGATFTHAEETPPPPPAAGEQPPPPPPPGGAEGRKAMMVDRLKRLSKELGLTEDQIAKAKPIFAEEAKALKALREEKDLSREDKKAKRDAIMKDAREKFSALLTPEQKAKFAEMKEKFEKHPRPGLGGPGGPGGAGGPPPEKQE